MNDNLILGGLSHHFTDREIADIISLFGDDPILSIIEDGTRKDRRRADRRKKTVAKKFELRQAKIEVSYEERRSQFFKAVDQWEHDNSIRRLVEHIVKSIDAQEDPDNRIIVESWLKDGIIYIRSNCDGWAEDVKPFILLESGDTVVPEDLVGLTESQAKHLYEMDQHDRNSHLDLIDDEEFIF